MFKAEWPQEKFNELKALVLEPLSASMIGVRLRMSRCAVIGKCRREGLSLYFKGKKTISTGEKKLRPRQGRKESKPRQHTPDGASLPDPAMQCTFMELKTTSCRWPIGEPDNLKSCGANKQEHSPYCGFHHRIAYAGRLKLTEAERERRRRWILKQSKTPTYSIQVLEATE